MNLISLILYPFFANLKKSPYNFDLIFCFPDLSVSSPLPSLSHSHSLSFSSFFIVAVFLPLSSQGLWEPMESPWPRMQAGRHGNTGMWAAWADKREEPSQQEVVGMKRESKRQRKKRVQGWSWEHDGIRANKLVSRGVDRITLLKTQQGHRSKRTERERMWH